MVLARCIEADADPVAALKRFEKARVTRTSTIVHRSTEAAQRFHNPELGNAEGAAAYVDREWTGEKIDQRYRWLFEYDALTVPV